MPVDIKPIKSIFSKLGRKSSRDDLESLIEEAFRESCPNNEILDKLASHGIYEPIARSLALGCNVDRELAWEALAFFALTGDFRRVRILRDHLGIEASNAGVALCLGDRRILVSGDLVLDSENLRGSWRTVGVDDWLWNTTRALGIDTIAHWGCEDAPGVDLRLLQRELLPEIDDNFTSILHGLNLDAERLDKALYTIAGFFAWLTSEIGHRHAHKLEAFKGLWEPCSGKYLIVTDSPRIDVPEYSEYSLDPSRLSSSTALSIYARGVDPRRLIGILKSKGLASIAAELQAALEPRSRKHGAGCIQIVPGSKVGRDLIRGRHVVFRCVEPRLKCIHMPETRIGIEGVSGAREATSDSGVLRGLVEESPSPVKVKIYSINTGGTIPVSSIVRLARDRRLNILVPSDALKLLLTRMGIRDASKSPDAPFYGELIVASWNDIMEKPYLASHRFLVVFPEALLRGRPYNTMLLEGRVDEVLSEALALVARFSGIAVSRSLPGEPLEEASAEQAHIDSSLIVDEAGRVFAELWGHDKKLRSHQEFVISLLSYSYSKAKSRTIMGVFPTGSGKSAIFQVTARVAARLGFGGYTLVVSPLKALMRDQVEGAVKRGLNAMRIDSSVPYDLREKAFKAARLGLLDLLYVTPERFQDERLIDLVSERPPSLIVLDEAHTLSLWGSTFRPSYLYMAKILASIAEEKAWPPVLLLTATAPEDLAIDILSRLGKESPVTVRVGEDVPDDMIPVIVRSNPVRDELFFDVSAVPRGDERIASLLETVRNLVDYASKKGSPWFGIVFTGFIKKGARDWATIDAIADALEKAISVPVIRYHGQLSASTRRRIEDEIYKMLDSGQGAVIVATKAFGMGVDIPVIRWVVHYYPSDSMEDFYQEAGRAGRDGKQSIVLEMFNPDDFIEKARMIKRQRIRPSTIVEAYNAIVRLLSVTRDNALVLPVDLFKAFGDDPLRLLDSMREAGLLDYTLTRGRLAAFKAEPRSEPLLEASYWSWRISRDYYIAPENIIQGHGPLSYPRFIVCQGEQGKAIRIESKAFTLALEEGCGETVRVVHGSTRGVIALVSLPPKPAPIDFLGPSEMQKILLSSHSMKKSLDYLKETLEEALAAKSIHGPEGADRTVKKRLEFYFESRRSKPSVSLAELSRIRTRCLSLERCIPLIVETVKDAVEAVGYSGVTLAVKNPRIAAVLNRELASHGVPVRASEKLYKSIANASRGSLLKLMDYGYTIVVVDNPSVATERVIDRISEYPYSAIYIVDAIS